VSRESDGDFNARCDISPLYIHLIYLTGQALSRKETRKFNGITAKLRPSAPMVYPNNPDCFCKDALLKSVICEEIR